MYAAIALPYGGGKSILVVCTSTRRKSCSIAALPAERFRVHWSKFPGHRVLVVEHKYVVARHVSHILENEGATVFRASSVAQALRIADNVTLSAAVLEIRLGSEDCDPVCRALAQRNIPFIFHTSHVRQLMIQWPGVPLVAKPASAAEIIGALNKVLSGKRDILDGEGNDTNIVKFLASV